MTEVMRKAVEIDEKHSNESDERLQSLLVENRGLKELLKIKSRFGVREDNYLMVDKEVNTENFEDMILEKDEDEKIDETKNDKSDEKINEIEPSKESSN